jgi:hypothetical protein
MDIGRAVIMHFPRKFSAVPLFDHGRHISSFPPNLDTPLRTAAVENVLLDSDPSGGRKAHAQLHACHRRPQAPWRPCRVDTSSTMPGVNVHGPRDSDRRMRAQR